MLKLLMMMLLVRDIRDLDIRGRRTTSCSRLDEARDAGRQQNFA